MFSWATELFWSSVAFLVISQRLKSVILINYKKNDYNEIINIIEKYKEKAPILKNILSAVIIMSERVEADIKKRLDFLISESLKNINYFLTRISIIIDRL